MQYRTRLFHTNLLNRSLARLSLPALGLLTLLGCSGQPRQEPIVFEGTPREQLQPQVDVNSLLAQAQQSISPKKEQLLLEAAAALYQQQELHWARNLLQSIPASVLSDADFIKYTLLFSDIALSDDAYFLAQRVLTDERLEQLWASVTPQDQILLRQRRADVFLILGEPDASVRERLALHPLLSTYGQSRPGLPGEMPNVQLDTSNHNNLWRTLMSMSIEELRKRTENTANLELRGWYQLALLSKDNQSNLERQQANIQYWRQQWPNHPASVELPSDLQFLQQLIAERPKRVALLLPQQGPLSRAANTHPRWFYGRSLPRPATGKSRSHYRLLRHQQRRYSQYAGGCRGQWRGYGHRPLEQTERQPPSRGGIFAHTNAGHELQRHHL